MNEINYLKINDNHETEKHNNNWKISNTRRIWQDQNTTLMPLVITFLPYMLSAYQYPNAEQMSLVNEREIKVTICLPIAPYSSSSLSKFYLFRSLQSPESVVGKQFNPSTTQVDSIFHPLNGGKRYLLALACRLLCHLGMPCCSVCSWSSPSRFRFD